MVMIRYLRRMDGQEVSWWRTIFMHSWRRKGRLGDALRRSFEDIKTMLFILDKR